MTNTTSITGSVVARAALASFLGYQYGTDRNIYEALGYPTTISFKEYNAKYERQDIASAIIDRPVEATWSGDFKIIESDDDEDTALELEWKDLAKKLKLKKQFLRLDKLSGLGMYGVLLVCFDDIKTRDNWKFPVASGKRSIMYTKPLSEGSAKIEKYVKDSQNPRYGFPELYRISIADGETNDSEDIIVHYSRVLHVVDGLNENEVLGTPRLKAIFNRLIDLEKLMGGSAEMFWRGARPGYQGKLDPEYTMTTEGKEALEEQIDEYEHNLRRILVNEGVDLSALSMQVADPQNHIDIQLQAISAKTRIPKRVLVGSERGELASTQDRDNWFDYIDSRRTNFAEDSIIIPFVDMCIQYKVIASPKKEYSIEWPPLYEQSDKDQAEVGKIRAMALKEYSSNPQAESYVPPKAFLKFFLGLDDKQIEFLEEMVKAEINNELEDQLNDDLDIEES